MLALMRVRRTGFTLHVAADMCVVAAVAAAAPPATLTAETLLVGGGMVGVFCQQSGRSH
jgi:hypothetical protein